MHEERCAGAQQQLLRHDTVCTRQLERAGCVMARLDCFAFAPQCISRSDRILSQGSKTDQLLMLEKVGDSGALYIFGVVHLSSLGGTIKFEWWQIYAVHMQTTCIYEKKRT